LEVFEDDEVVGIAIYRRTVVEDCRDAWF